MDRTTSDRPLLDFYIRRLFRIYPLNVVVIACILLFQIPAMPDLTYRWIGYGGILANITLTDNITRSPIVTGPLWSLSYEVQMYLLLPFVHRFLQVQRGLKPAVVLWLWSILIRALLLYVNIDLWLIHFVPCFLSGAIAYRIYQMSTIQVAAFLWPIAIAAAGLLHVLLSGNSSTLFFHSDYVLCLVVGIAIPYFHDLPVSFVTRVCRAIATHSYGIYLLHVPIMWLAFVRMHVPGPLRWAAFATMMVLLPYLSYRYLEQPLINTGRRFARQWAGRKDEQEVVLAG